MNFMTLFDSGYSYKGWTLQKSLQSFSKEAKLYVFCFDDEVFRQSQDKTNVIPIHLNELEAFYPELKQIKNSRSKKEYIVTTKPFLPHFIFKKTKEEKICFVDADICFFNSPENIESAMKDYSIFLYDLDLDKPRPSGHITSGFMGFRNDQNSEEFLKWWQKECIKWCFWKAGSNNKYAEQGYLNIFETEPNKFKNFFLCKDNGIHIGSWNIARHKLSRVNNELIIDDKYKLICFHFHEFKLTKDGYYPTGWPLRKEHYTYIYEPYFNYIKEYLGK